MRLKEERARNQNIIRRQKEAELMKNNNVKQMIRQQKLMAEERKEMVSSNSLNKCLIRALFVFEIYFFPKIKRNSINIIICNFNQQIFNFIFDYRRCKKRNFLREID